MIVRVFLIFAAALVTADGTISCAAAAGWNDAKRAEAQRLVRNFLRPAGPTGGPQAPALSLTLGYAGDLVWTFSEGDARPGTPATTDTVYRIGSLTKQFTAAGILRLTEIGAVSAATGKRITLDGVMSDYFDGVEAWTVAGQMPITVRSLLTMTSNLPNFTRRPPKGLNPWGAVPAPNLLAAVKSYRPSGWPNSFEYSNTSYFLLAELIEATRLPGEARSLDYRRLMREGIVARAGLASTGFAEDEGLGSRLAQGTLRRGQVFNQPDWLKGSGDMVSTAADMFLWNKALLSGAVISAQSLEEMLTEGARISPLVYYGMGWFISQSGSWTHYTHTGTVPGFTSCNAVARRPDSADWISVSVMTNSDAVEGIDQLAEDLMLLVEAD